MTKTNEYIIHRDLLDKSLKFSPNANGFGWIEGAKNQVSSNGMIIKDDILTFLKFGNLSNERSWSNLVKEVGGENKAIIQAEDAISEAIDNCDNVIQILRDGVKISAYTFSLWNRPFQRGSIQSSLGDFNKNIFKTVPEVTIKSSINNKRYKRVDQAFYINGMLFSFIEVKAKQTLQRASKEGVEKLSSDFRFFAFEALTHIRKKFTQDNRLPLEKEKAWPGIDAGDRYLNSKYKKEVLNLMPAYTKTAWIATMDGSQIIMGPDPNIWLSMCDASLTESLKKNNQSITDLDAVYNTNLDSNLNTNMPLLCQRLPDIQGRSSSWDIVVEHLEGLLSKSGVSREINIWHHSIKEKTKSDRVIKGNLLRPRAPQRVALQQIISLVDQYYEKEFDPNWIEEDLEYRLQISLPSLSEDQITKIINDRLKYKNGRDAYSILIQGAAGLGKTNIAVWSAIELYSLLSPLPKEADPKSPRSPLFDRIVILTDRVELRENIATEAARSAGSRGQVLEVEDKETLIAALTGSSLPKDKINANILVVNLQKFPSLKSAISSGDVSVKHSVGRTAFIIDEVHRSQSGELNEAALTAFLDDITNLASNTDASNNLSYLKKNLIIGLTATPSDPILARFGQWRPGVGASDSARWVPHFAYAMNKAIEDGYVLNPLKKLVRLEIPIDIKVTPTIQSAENLGANKLVLSSNRMYEDEKRQRLVARKHATIFASTTMRAIPQARGSRVGRGKSMITVPSIRAAISMVRLIREELSDLAQNAEGKPWERYKDIVDDVAKNRVFVLFSNNTSQGNEMGRCGQYNPSDLNEKQIIEAFRCRGGKNHEVRNSIIVVVDKLLTGFDEPTLHTFHIDRSLTGISLFQAMCRPNRVTEGKRECIIIDTCHDNTVWREAKKTFAKYGGLATSDLDGLDLLGTLEKTRIDLLNNEDLRSLMRKSNNISSDQRALACQKWADEKRKDIKKANQIRRQIGGYLSNQKLARPIMDLSKDDLDKRWLDLLSELHNLLKMQSDEDKKIAPILFEVQDEFINVLDVEINKKVDEIKGKACDNKVNKDKDKTTAEHVVDLIEQLENIQQSQEERRKRLDEIKAFFNEIFKQIDEKSKEINNDSFRRALKDKHDPLSFEEGLSTFTDFFDNVTSNRQWLPKGDIRKQYVEQIRSKIDLLFIDYQLRIGA